MADSKTTQQVSDEALIAEAKAITANFRLNRDERELNERLLALGIDLTAALQVPAEALIAEVKAIDPTAAPYWPAESETEKRFLALGFITGAISDKSELEKNLLALIEQLRTNF